MDSKKELEKLESLLPEEFRDVVTANTIAAEKQFLKEVNERNAHLGKNVQLQRMHVSWGPNAKHMTKEQLVDYLWSIENQPMEVFIPPPGF